MERSGGEPQTTNNRMELTAAVRGLEALKRRSQVELLTDSVYVGKGISEWLPKWKANGWRRKEKNKLVPIANEELWRELDELLAKHEVKYTRVAGHSGHAGKRPRRRTRGRGVSAVSCKLARASCRGNSPTPYNDGMSALPPTAGQQTSPRRQPTPAELLATPVEFVRGVGPQRAALLHRLDVRTAGDLIFLFPRDYEDLTDRRRSPTSKKTMCKRSAARSSKSMAAAAASARASSACW